MIDLTLSSELLISVSRGEGYSKFLECSVFVRVLHALFCWYLRYSEFVNYILAVNPPCISQRSLSLSVSFSRKVVTV